MPSSSSATLQATINPEGAATSYAFEYAPAGGTFVAVPEAAGKGSIAEGTSGVPVSVHVQAGLSAHTTYQFRVVAVNSVQSVTGEPVPFTTQPLGEALALPDQRVWEMVSPPEKEGAQLGEIVEGIIQASSSGDAISDWTLFEPMEEKAQGAFGFSEANFFGRGSDGWHAKTITPPHAAVGRPPVGNGQEYRMFSEDLSRAILQPFGPATPLAPGVTESTPYIRADYLNGNPGEICGSNCYQPLVSAADTPAGTMYGGEPEGKCEDVLCGPRVVGANPDLTHVVISSSVQITTTSTEGQVGLYEWSKGALQLISLLPPGETNQQGGAVAINPVLGEGDNSARHAISDDGSRIVWAGQGKGYYDHLYLSEMGSGETIRLDVPNVGVAQPSGEGTPLFMTASSDGSRVFFLDKERLTRIVQ